MDENIKLGVQARDKVTKFEGIVTSEISYLTGCKQYGVTPEVKDGKLGVTEYFDGARLEFIGCGIHPADVADDQDPGGPNRDAPTR
jgi:hypothetical protein